MRTLKRNWMSPNEWLLKEVATALFPQKGWLVRNKGEGVVESVTVEKNFRLVIGRVVVTELRPGKRAQRYRHEIESIECAFVVTNSNKLYAITVDIEWVDEDSAA